MPPNTHIALLKNFPGYREDKRVASGSKEHCERVLAKYDGKYEGYVRELTADELK